MAGDDTPDDAGGTGDTGGTGGRRRYESLRRLAQANQTREVIAEAARRLFLSRGWAGTTVRDVAQEAGVSAPTVYAAYGNKAALARALAASADLSADLPRLLAELEAADTPVRQLVAMVGFDRRLYERSGDLILLLREAGRAEPELAGFYLRARREADQTRIQVFSGWPSGTLRTDLDSAVDIYAAMCNIDSYTTFTVERGWPSHRVEAWWCEALPRELLSTG